MSSDPFILLNHPFKPRKDHGYHHFGSYLKKHHTAGKCFDADDLEKMEIIQTPAEFQYDRQNICQRMHYAVKKMNKLRRLLIFFPELILCFSVIILGVYILYFNTEENFLDCFTLSGT